MFMMTECKLHLAGTCSSRVDAEISAKSAVGCCYLVYFTRRQVAYSTFTKSVITISNIMFSYWLLKCYYNAFHRFLG